MTMPDTEAWPVGSGEMAARIREFDWASTSLGAVGQWSRSLRSLVDFTLSSALPCAIVCGPDQLLLYNDSCAAVQGDLHPASLGKRSAGKFPEGFSNAVGDVHARLLAGETMSFLSRPWVFQRQGALVAGYFDAHFTPVRDDDGRFAFVHAIVLDAGLAAATGPSEAPKQSRTSSPDTLWVLDHAAMRLDYASPALEQLVGRARDGVVDDFQRWVDLVHPADRSTLDEHLSRAAAGEAVVTEYHITRPQDGRVVAIRQTSFPIQGSNASPGRMAGIVQDITALQQASVALVEETERLQSLVDGMPHLVWRSSSEGLWTWASEQWLNYTGQTQEQSHAWGWLDAVHPDDREATMQDWHRARPHGVLDTMYRVRRASDRAWRWHHARSLPRRAATRQGEPDGQIIEWIGTSTDVHERQVLQLEQQWLLQQLERRAAGLATVAESIGH